MSNNLAHNNKYLLSITNLQSKKIHANRFSKAYHFAKFLSPNKFN